MIINNVLYPYPVLSDHNTDYINSGFDVDYKIEEKGFYTKQLQAEFKLSNTELEKMVEDKLACYVLHIECPRTSYRRLLQLSSHVTKLNIDTDKMREKLEVSGFIVSNIKIEEYTNGDINSEIYGDNYSVKNLEKGTILAATLTQTVDIETNQNDFQDISSVISVGESQDSLMTVDMDGDILLIKMPKDDYKKYVTLSRRVISDIVMTSTILPSLVYTLDAMRARRADPDLLWYKAIEQKLETKNIEVEDINESHSSLELAQLILESPLERALSTMEAEIERGGE